jgi:hypothetical protein
VILESRRAFQFVSGENWGFEFFVWRDLLLDEGDDMLPEDRLTVLCEVRQEIVIFCVH